MLQPPAERKLVSSLETRDSKNTVGTPLPVEQDAGTPAADVLIGTSPEPAAELVRNRLLRRVDWRFLLANPQPRRSVCYCDGEVLEAIRLISESVCDPRTSEAGDCDLAVALNPTRAVLMRAFQALSPGGNSYVEFTGALTPHSVRSRLAAAGYGNIRILAPQADVPGATPHQWAPVDGSAPIRYAIAGLPRVRTPWGRVHRAFRQALWLSSPRLRFAAPICAIAERMPDARATGAHDGDRRADGEPTTSFGEASDCSLEAIVRGGWERWGMGPAPRRVAFVLLTGGRRTVNKVVALAFGDTDRDPRIAIKMARVPESIAGLDQEAKTLRALGARRTRPRGVPAVIFYRNADAIPLLGQSVVTGRQLLRVLSPATVQQLALDATTWQIELAGTPSSWSAAMLQDRLVEPIVASFAASYGSVLDPGMLREATDAVRALGDLPQVCEQRDFSPWNVLITADGELAVLDWESSELEGLPLQDLIYLFTYLSVYLGGAVRSGRYEQSYLDMLDPSTRVGTVARSCLELYSTALGLDRERLRPLRILTWMLHSRSAHAQLLADAGGRAPAPEQLRETPFAQFWRAELRHGERF